MKPQIPAGATDIVPPENRLISGVTRRPDSRRTEHVTGVVAPAVPPRVFKTEVNLPGQS